LKPDLARGNIAEAKVAPRTGAWIETMNSTPSRTVTSSPPARGRGLKLVKATNVFIRPRRRPPHGGVD